MEMADLPMSAFPNGDLDDAFELGGVTDRSVRVWLRRPDGAPVTLHLETLGQAPIEQPVTVNAETDWTASAVLELPRPAPDQTFTVKADCQTRTARFAPDPGTHGDLSFGFGSCHFPFARVDEQAPIRKREAAGIYPAMQSALAEAEARFLLTIGDQLYADALPGISVRDDLPGDEQHPPPFDIALTAYRRITRGFFAESGFKRVRESLPTLCIWDDHDIFNDWGSRLEETPLDRQLFAAADQVFREYQQSRNPVTTSLSRGDRPPYPFFSRFGTVGFLVLDLRGARDYTEGRLLGRAQWDLIHAFFASETIEDIETLFVVVSVPIAHTSRWLVELFQRLPWGRADSVRDRWCSKEFIASRDELLADLFQWQSAKPARQAILLSGDVHAASAFTIRNQRGPGVVHQFTSSAYTSPCVGVERVMNQLGTYAANLGEPDLQFERRFLTVANNVGIVRLIALPSGGHQVTFDVRAWHPERRRLVAGGLLTVAPASDRSDM